MDQLKEFVDWLIMLAFCIGCIYASPTIWKIYKLIKKGVIKWKN